MYWNNKNQRISLEYRAICHSSGRSTRRKDSWSFKIKTFALYWIVAPCCVVPIRVPFGTRAEVCNTGHILGLQITEWSRLRQLAMNILGPSLLKSGRRQAEMPWRLWHFSLGKLLSKVSVGGTVAWWGWSVTVVRTLPVIEFHWLDEIFWNMGMNQSTCHRLVWNNSA